MYEYEHHDELGGLLEDAEYETYQMWMSETCDETRRVDKKKQLCIPARLLELVESEALGGFVGTKRKNISAFDKHTHSHSTSIHIRILQAYTFTFDKHTHSHLTRGLCPGCSG